MDTSRHEEIIETMFSFSPSGEAELFLEKPVRLPPTRAELRWLKTMLEDESAAFLVANDLRGKLLLRLAEVRAYLVRCATVVVTGVLLAEAARRVDSGLGDFVDDACGLPRGIGRFDDPRFLA